MHKGLPGPIGTSLARSGFFLRVSFVRRGIGVAAGRPSGRDFCTHAPHCVGAGHLLCRGHSFELEIRLHHPHRFLGHDHDVFDCCGMAFSEEANLKSCGPQQIMPALTHLDATLTSHPTSVDSKQLTASLNPPESPLTKNIGGRECYG